MKIMMRHQCEELLMHRYDAATPEQKRGMYELIVTGGSFDLVKAILDRTDPGTPLYPGDPAVTA